MNGGLAQQEKRDMHSRTSAFLTDLPRYDVVLQFAAMRRKRARGFIAAADHRLSAKQYGKAVNRIKS